MSPFITFFIPTKNAMSDNERLDRLLYSIQQQTYPHYEVIIVDGGSKDTTKQICSTFPFVRFISLKGSISDATNYALCHMRGDYIFLLDADMILPINLLKECALTILNTGVDCIEIMDTYLPSSNALFFNGATLHEIEVGLGAGPLSILFYSKNIIGNIKMPNDISFAEDYVFRQRILEKNPKIGKINLKLYHYFDPSLIWLMKRSYKYAKMMKKNKKIDGFVQTSFIKTNSIFNRNHKRYFCTQNVRFFDPFVFPLYLGAKYLSFFLGIVMTFF